MLHWRNLARAALLLSSACTDDLSTPRSAPDDGPAVSLDAGSLLDASDASSLLDASDAASWADVVAPARSTLTLQELGHARDVTVVRLSGERMLSQDVSGHWVLWEVATHRMVASGQSALRPDREEAYTPQLLAQTLAVQVEGGLELRDASDGRILAMVRAPAENLSIDGSYVWEANHEQLWVWSRTGQLLGSLFGDYTHALVFAAPDELRVVSGTAAAMFITRLRASDDTIQSLPCPGTFLAWFADGEHFIVDDPLLGQDGKSYVAVYDASANFVGKFEKPETVRAVGGYGQYLWFERPGANGPQDAETLLQRLDGGDTTTAQGPTFGIQGGVLAGAYEFHDLRGSARVTGIYRTAYDTRHIPVVAGDPSSARLVEPVGALIFVSPADGNAPFGTGPVLSISAAPTGRVAVATADGQVRVYDLELEGARPICAIPLLAASLSLSDDGKILVSQSESALVQTFHVPECSLLHRFGGLSAYPTGYVSHDAARLLLFSCVGNGKTEPRVCHSQLTSADGTQQFPLPIPDGDVGYPQRRWLSPDGLRVATPTFEMNQPLNSYRIGIYAGGLKTAVARGQMLGWLDDTHLLVADYADGAPSVGPTYQGDVVIDLQGNVVQHAGPERMHPLYSSLIAPIDEAYFFELSRPSDAPESTWPAQEVPYEAGVWTRADLMRAWQPTQPVTGPAAYAGERIVYTSNARVVAEPWR